MELIWRNYRGAVGGHSYLYRYEDGRLSMLYTEGADGGFYSHFTTIDPEEMAAYVMETRLYLECKEYEWDELREILPTLPPYEEVEAEIYEIFPPPPEEIYPLF